MAEHGHCHRHGQCGHEPAHGQLDQSAASAQKCGRKAVPLRKAPAGVPLVLAGVTGGVMCHRRLMEMGLRPGISFSVVTRGQGPLIVSMKDNRLMLGHGMVERISVYVCGENDRE